MMIRSAVIVFGILLLVRCGYCLDVSYGVGFRGIVDNREYSNSLDISQTFFGARLSPELDFSIDSLQRLVAGIDLLHEFGSQSVVGALSPVAYYDYQSKQARFQIGVFPRLNLIEFPRALLSDSVCYYRPDLEGMFLSRSWGWGNESVWIDWTGRQTVTIRESFLVGIAGEIDYGRFFFQHDYLYFHDANRGVRLPGDQVQDNMGGVALVGLHARRVALFDSLFAAAGCLLSAEQNRSDGTGYHAAAGGMGRLDAAIKWGGAQLTVSSGQAHHLDWGDPLYGARTYGRLDLFLLPINTAHVNARLAWVFHYVQGHIGNSQTFLLNADISGKVCPRADD